MGKKSRAEKERKQESLVVFCTANVCRSPMAEKLFEDALSKSDSQKHQSFFRRNIRNGW